MKRIILFALTNVAVVAVLGLMSSLFGINRFLTANGLNLGTLLGFALVMGFTGAIISLLMSKLVAKWSMGVQIINDSPDGTHQWLVQTVKRFADKAGIAMPEVGIYEGEANAFATGAFKNSSLVAVSTGLLQSMNREEVEAVIGRVAQRARQIEGRGVAAGCCLLDRRSAGKAQVEQARHLVEGLARGVVERAAQPAVAAMARHLDQFRVPA